MGMNLRRPHENATHADQSLIVFRSRGRFGYWADGYWADGVCRDCNADVGPAGPVGRLGATGHTGATRPAGPNRQLAQELVISERTADGHVANILAKLGPQTRAQAAVWVVELPLAHAPS